MSIRRTSTWSFAVVLVLLSGCASTAPNPRLDPLREAAKAAPGDADTQLELAHAAIQEEQWKEARSTFRKVVKLRPQDADAWFWYGVTETNLGHQESAEPHWRRAIELDSTHLGANRTIGTLNLERILMFERAADETMLGRMPGSELTILQEALLIVWEIRIGDLLKWYQETLDIWKRMVELEPEAAQNWGNLGIIGNLVGAYSDSKRCLNAALNLDPDFLNTHELHAEFYAASSMGVRWVPKVGP